MLERYLLAWLVVSSAISYSWPVLSRQIPSDFDPFVATTPAMISWLIGITMFAIGMMMPRDELRQVLRHWPTVLGGTLVQLLLGMALSADTYDSFSMVDVSGKLFLTVVGPVLAGHLLSRTFPSWERQAKQRGSLVANLAILWIIAVVVGQNRERIGQVPLQLLAALILVNVCGYAAGFLGGRAMRLSVPMRRALTLEVGMQNAGLGTWLAITLFPGTTAAIAPAIYTFGCMLTGTLLANVWARLTTDSEPATGDTLTRPSTPPPDLD